MNSKIPLSINPTILFCNNKMTEHSENQTTTHQMAFLGVEVALVSGFLNLNDFRSQRDRKLADF